MFRRRCLIALSLLFGFIAAPSAFAQSQDFDVRPLSERLTGDAITQAFKGITHEGAYNFDALGRPGRFYKEIHAPDGGITYEERGGTVTGRWRVSPKDEVCYSYDGGLIAGGCFQVYQLGTCYYFYSALELSFRDDMTEDDWTARSVKKGDRASCEDMIS